jgi:hypothetical protein
VVYSLNASKSEVLECKMQSEDEKKKGRSSYAETSKSVVYTMNALKSKILECRMQSEKGKEGVTKVACN